MNKKFGLIMWTCLVIGLTLYVYEYNTKKSKNGIYESSQDNRPVHNVNMSASVTADTTAPNEFQVSPNGLPDFTQIASKAIASTVHVKVNYEEKEQSTLYNNSIERFFKDFFGQDFDTETPQYKKQPQQSAGTGFFISSDGYIVTNNHVIENASQIEITLNDNRRYKAKVIGQDSSTDVAVLKIEEQNLPYLKFGNSDNLKIGDWVCAVGNPYGLNFSFTTGNVSAFYRTISDGKKSKKQVESFIQTNVAINKGNSGGPLMNLSGQVVGINTAILGANGAFAGISFSIPSNLVELVVKQLIEHGVFVRAMLGISIRTVDADLVQEKGLKQLSGVYVAEVSKNATSNSKEGLLPGDIIIAINGKRIHNNAQLCEQMVHYKPNEKIQLNIYRNDKEMIVDATLKDTSSQLVVHKNDIVEVGGATFENIDQVTQKKLGITEGIQIKAIKDGPWKSVGLGKGSIITSINNTPVRDIKSLCQILGDEEKLILVVGILQSGKEFFCAVDLCELCGLCKL